MDEQRRGLAPEIGRLGQQAERWYAVGGLALGAGRFAAGDQHSHAGCSQQQGLGDESAGVEQVLAVVEDEQGGAGDPAHREALLAARGLAEARGAAVALARAALAIARGPCFSVWGADAERVALLEAALQVVPEADAAVRTRLLATLGAELDWEPDHRGRCALSDEGLAHGPSLR